jgi:hypothetical protein
MKILGFEVIVQSSYNLYWEAHKAEWSKGNYLASRVEFGASPIRDKKALERYCAMLTANGLDYTVHPIVRSKL